MEQTSQTRQVSASKAIGVRLQVGVDASGYGIWIETDAKGVLYAAPHVNGLVQ